METKFWDDTWDSVKTLDEALEWAQEEFEQYDKINQIIIYEVRKPEFSDLPDLFEGTLEYICDMVEHGDELQWENGGPRMDGETTSEQAIALRNAIIEYLRRNVDLSEASWQNTGMILRVTQDGYELIERAF